MNDTTVLSSADRAEKLQGLGCKRRRVEDARFIQGKGNYVDDLKLPGMLYGDFARSPYAHARVKKIDASQAKALPGVLAVLTAADLKPLGLHYMPTLAGDVQAVLAEDKVLYQNQEVAFVIATDRYTAADAVELIEVDYEALPVIVDPFKAMAADAPVLREDIKDKTEGAHGKRKHHNHIFTWEVGDAAATDAAFDKAEVTINELISYQRVHPAPLETCQCIASFDKVRSELTVWGTFQAPHVIRTVASLISKIPEHKIHIISPDIGGGFGNKVGAYAGYICAIVASIVTGRPVKWVEDRIENLTTTAFARDYHMQTEIAATRDGRVTGLRVYTIADHGAFDACADPSKWPAGFFNIVTGSYDFPVAHVTVDTAPYGLGTYGSRSTPVSGAATAMAARKIKAKAQMIAAYLLEVHDDDLDWDVDRFRVKGNPERFKTMKELAWAAYHGVPPGMEPGLEAVSYYDPPNLTYPFGAYICVLDVDVDTGETKVRRFYALDDCGTRINPMIIEGQIHGGLTEAFGIAFGQEIHYDETGNVTTATFQDYFMPTAVETPKWETDWTTTPSPHHPIGAKGVGESPNVGGVPCFANAVNDAFRFLGSTHIAMPHDHWRTWTVAEKLGLHK